MEVRCSILLTGSILLISLSSSLRAQKVQIDATLVQVILAEPREVRDIIIPIEAPRPIESLDIGFAKGRDTPTQKLVRTSKELFALVDGTGRVYKISAESEDIQVERVDSTVFEGYNFGAIGFTYRDTIYSYGGYGFWHYNGHLRFYVPAKSEWERIDLNREIPIQTANPLAVTHWLDTRNGILYLVGMSTKGLVTDSIHRLEISKRTWSVLGTSIIPALSQPIQTPWGILAKNPNHDFFLIDFIHNQVLQLNEQKSLEIRAIEDWKSLMYVSDSTLICYRNGLHQVQLSLLDFQSTAVKVFEPPVPRGLAFISKDMLLGFFLGLVTTAVAMLVPRFARSIKFGNSSTLSADNENGGKFFDEKERDLITLIMANSAKGSSTTIDEINRILGLTDKSQDVQKKHRSDLTISINKKFSYLEKRDTPLLRRSRSDLDKRTFEYFIDVEDYDTVTRLVNGRLH